MAFEYTKQPWEEEIIGVDFSRRIPKGVTILPVAVDVTDVVLEETTSPQGLNPSNYADHIEIGTPGLTGVDGREKILAVKVSKGVSGFKYRLAFKITLSDGQKKEDDVTVVVKES